MDYPTLGDLITELDEELDLQEDDSIEQSTKIKFLDKGQDEAIAEILKLGLEDQYFKAKQPLNMVSGTNNYGLPTNIYANKILRVIYRNGTKVYEIKRMRRRHNTPVELQAAEISSRGNMGQRYEYMIINDGASFGNEITLYPTPNETVTIEDAIWYVRKPTAMAELDDVCEVPQFSAFVVQFAKVKCLAKIYLGNVPEYEVGELQRLRELMVTTLTEMVPDENNVIDPDVSFYDSYDSDQLEGF